MKTIAEVFCIVADKIMPFEGIVNPSLQPIRVTLLTDIQA